MKKYLSTCACVLIIFMFCFCTSCVSTNDSFIKRSYDTIYAAAVTYDTSMTLMGDMYRIGKINEEQKAKIVEYAYKYYSTVQAVKKALIKYKQAEIELRALESNKNKNELKKAEIIVLNSLQFVNDAEADLLKLIK